MNEIHFNLTRNHLPQFQQQFQELSRETIEIQDIVLAHKPDTRSSGHVIFYVP